MLELRQTQSLKLVQSPQQILLSTLLQLQVQALELRIQNELEMNPVLEEESLALDTEIDESEQNEEEEFGVEDFFESEQDSQSGSQFKRDDDIPDMPQVSRLTFTEYLMDQLHQMRLDEEEMMIGEEIVWNIDSNGYLGIPLDEIAELHDVDRSLVDRVHRRILTLDPPGVGATSLRECLLTQLEERKENGLSLILVRDCFADYANKRFDKIARALDITLEEIRDANEVISTLNPKPGLSFTDQQLDYVIPDFIVERIDGNLVVTLNDFSLPELRISDRYKTMVADKKNVDKVTRTYLKKKIEAARWLIASIYQRKLTMLRVMETIVKRQLLWFEKGPGHLRPMIQKDVAKDIGMDHSTVSRATDGKYVQTEHGVFPLKYFFSEGLQTDNGEIVSTSNVKLRLKELIENEPSDSPLSDEMLAKLLAEDGYRVARRTVAKYREKMNLPVARLRRKIGV